MSLFGYPYSQAGEFNWQLAAHPYVALCMDRKGESKLRNDNIGHHLEYFGDIKCDAVGSRPFLYIVVECMILIGRKISYC